MEQRRGPGASWRTQPRTNSSCKHLTAAWRGRGRVLTTLRHQRRSRRPMTLPCSHLICESCADQWFEVKQECPFCKETVCHLPPLPPPHRASAGGASCPPAADRRRPPRWPPSATMTSSLALDPSAPAEKRDAALAAGQPLHAALRGQVRSGGGGVRSGGGGGPDEPADGRVGGELGVATREP